MDPPQVMTRQVHRACPTTPYCLKLHLMPPIPFAILPPVNKAPITKQSFEQLANPWIGGLAPYEPGRPIDEVARELGFPDASAIIKLASNENALGPSPKALAAMKAVASDMHRYPDGNAFHLRHALAQSLGLTPEQVIPTNGSNEAIEFLGHVFLGPGTSIVMDAQAFVVYKLIARMFQATVITVPGRNFTHDPDALLAAIRPDTRIVFFSNPNNPTGTMIDGPAIERFMKAVPSHVVVCFDEAYIELLAPEKQPDTIRYIKESRNVVILRTFSKTYGLAGLRIGYAAAPAACINLLQRVRQPFNVNAMGLAAATAALGDEQHLIATRKLVADGLVWFEARFKALGWSYVPAVTNFFLLKVGNGKAIFNALLREGIIVRPMDVYGLPEYIRITVGTAAENEACLAALQKVLKGSNS